MQFDKKNILFFILLFFFLAGFGQEKKGRTVNDSTDIYIKIKTYSEKRKVTRTIYDWLFKGSSNKVVLKNEREPIDYEPYKDKIVRRIIIDTKDPFGYSITDSTKVPRKWMEKVGNTIHIQSKEFAIKNFLLIKEKEVLDIPKTRESARLLRTQDFIRDAIIVPQELAHTKDSIDLVITSLDSWSLIPEVSISKRKAGGKLKERNFMGLGHRAEFGYLRQLDEPANAFDAVYTVPNIRNSFIGVSGNYSIDFENYFQKSISVDRIFVSPFTKWAGGIFTEERSTKRPVFSDDNEVDYRDIKFTATDFWGAYAFLLTRDYTEQDRFTNLILSSRFYTVNYPKRPSLQYDPDHFFSAERFLMGSISMSSREYIEDYYIFKDGYTEDVPVGSMYSLTIGTHNKNNQNRFYGGLRFSRGDYFNFGFLSGNIEMGTFFNKGKTEQSAISIQFNYFSKLISIGNWKFRQFLKPQMIFGINRLDSPADRLSLNETPYYTGSDGKVYEEQYIGVIHGFESHVFGNNKYVLDIQTQFYSPWALWGFRINPYANISLGMLTSQDHSPGSNKLYGSFGLGCIIRNDYLVFESFQFSFAFYPDIPGEGKGLFKWNSFDTSDFGFQDFSVSKPRTVFYR